MEQEKTFLQQQQIEQQQSKKHNIKNKLYRKMLDENEIEVITEDQIRTVLDKIVYPDKEMARCLVIVAYYTGARPNEYIRLRAKDISMDGRYFIIKIKGSKRGVPRSIWFKKNDLLKELYAYRAKLFPDMFIFHRFIGKYKRIRKVKSGYKETIETHQKVTFWFKKWFKCLNLPDTITPYYLRHNRFSKMASKGATDRELKQVKGCKSEESISYYIHQSKDTGKKAATKID